MPPAAFHPAVKAILTIENKAVSALSYSLRSKKSLYSQEKDILIIAKTQEKYD